jgi:hypothetical protein
MCTDSSDQSKPKTLPLQQYTPVTARNHGRKAEGKPLPPARSWSSWSSPGRQSTARLLLLSARRLRPPEQLPNVYRHYCEAVATSRRRLECCWQMLPVRDVVDRARPEAPNRPGFTPRSF